MNGKYMDYISTTFTGELVFGSFTKDGAVYYLKPEEVEIYFDKEFLKYRWKLGLDNFEKII